MQVPLLGQIPVVQSICENADNGTPVALDPASPTGQAFLQLAARVVTETDRRNIEKEQTKVVSVKG
jgi:ATP-binding protein involved in chromosome partitioning